MKDLVILVVISLFTLSCQKGKIDRGNGIDVNNDIRIDTSNADADSIDNLSLFLGLAQYGNRDTIFFYVNDSLVFNQILSVCANDTLMLRIAKTDSIMKFHLIVNDRDTSFYYNITNADSLVFGVYKYFYVFDQTDPYGWLYE